MDERTPFSAGEPCLLFDDRERQYLLTLKPEAEFQFHLGMLPHSAIIGTLPGTVLYSTKGSELIPMRPRLADYVLKMKRGATPVYPKDAGAILVWADIGPGMTVLEAGTGSGGLTMALARAVGASGRVVSVERREDHAAVAERRMSTFFGGMPPQVEVRIGDVVDHVAEVHADRIILDIPEPWHVVPGAAEHLPGGGILAGYLPTVPQVQALRQAIADRGSFIDVVTFELLLREWAIDGRSVRPEHRMVGHTGFITIARRRL